MKNNEFVGKSRVLWTRLWRLLRQRFFDLPRAPEPHRGQARGEESPRTMSPEAMLSERAMDNVIQLDQRRKSRVNSLEPPQKSLVEHSVRVAAEISAHTVAPESRFWRQARVLAGLLILTVSAVISMTLHYSLKYVLEGEEHWGADHVITTAHLEPRTHALSDGSEVALRGRTMLRCNVDGNPRHVWLWKGGAHFDVLASPTTPFQVSTYLANATATADAEFSIFIDRSVTFVVDEGTITLTLLDAPPRTSTLTLTSGQSYRVAPYRLVPVVAMAVSDEQQTKDMWVCGAPTGARPLRG